MSTLSPVALLFLIVAFFLELKAIEHRGDHLAPVWSIGAWVALGVALAAYVLGR